MNNRIASYIPLGTFPAAFLFLRYVGTTATPVIAILLACGGLAIAVGTCIIAVKQRDARIRNRSIGGIIINALFLAMLLTLMLVTFPEAKRLTDEAAKEPAAREVQLLPVPSPTPSASPATR